MTKGRPFAWDRCLSSTIAAPAQVQHPALPSFQRDAISTRSKQDHNTAATIRYRPQRATPIVFFHRYPIVRPAPGSTKLAVSEEGLRFLENLQGPVAPVIVIGPYRSGKSFLLNQLLRVDCGEWRDLHVFFFPIWLRSIIMKHAASWPPARAGRIFVAVFRCVRNLTVQHSTMGVKASKPCIA